MSTLPPDPRLHELLADCALDGLDTQQQAELAELLAAAGVVEDNTYDLTAATAALAMGSPSEQMPASLRSKLESQARIITATFGETSPTRNDVIGSIKPASRASTWGWLAAAACLALAVLGWLPRLGAPSPSIPVVLNSTVIEDFVRSTPDAKRAPWGDFNSLADGSAPEVAGVKGEVVWSESKQTGYMRLSGLKPNDPRREQYQLWIVDERGLNQRVSGAIFDAASGDVIVPIEPRIQIKNAAIFAVTIEAPGGTWVSDMTRRACLAALPKG